MPWSINNLPPSVEGMNLSDKEKEKFVAVANSVLKETGDEGMAIASGLATIKKKKEKDKDFDEIEDSKKETKNLNFEIKSFDEEKGIFEGYASVFGNKDSYGDIVHKGAFTESLTKRKPKLLWQHKIDTPIGVYEEVREDENGLFVRGKFTLGVQKAKEAYELLKDGALDGLSIGYSIAKNGCTFDEEKEIRNLNKLNLFEISLVTVPANEKATITNIKSEKSVEDFENLKDAENFLKNPYALSNKEAKTFISKITEFKLSHREDEDKKSKTVVNDERDVQVKKAVDEIKKYQLLTDIYLSTKNQI